MKWSGATALICGLAAGGAAGFSAVRAVYPAPRPPAAAPRRAAEADALPESWRPRRMDVAEARTELAAWLAQRGTPGERLEALRALLLVLPTESLPALLDGLLAEPAEASGALRQLAFDVWVERDPAGAARWAAAQGAGKSLVARIRENWCRQAGVEWARRDFAAAYDWVSALADTKLAETLAGRVLDVLAERDPRRALELADARGDAFARGMQERILRVWAKREPAEAVRTLGPGVLANGGSFWSMSGAAREWLRQDLQGALSWLNEQPRLQGNGVEFACDDLMRQSENPAAVADTVAGMRGLAKRTEILANAVEEWGVRQPEAAGAWLAGLSDGVLRSEVLAHITQGYSTENPEKSLPLALSLPDGPERAKWLGMLLGGWAQNDAGAAEAWLATPTGAAVMAAVPDLASHIEVPRLEALAKTDPQRAATQGAALPPGRARDEAMARIAVTWAAKDPKNAMEWFAAQILSKGVNAYSIMQNAFYPWSQKDPDAALGWAETQVESVKNAALSSLRGDINGDRPSPSRLAGVLAKIKEPTVREQMLGLHLEEWLRANRPAAREWIENNDVLPAEQAAKLLLAAGAAGAPKN